MQNYVLKQAIYQKLKNTCRLANLISFRKHWSKLFLSILFMEQFCFEVWCLKLSHTSKNKKNCNFTISNNKHIGGF